MAYVLLAFDPRWVPTAPAGSPGSRHLVEVAAVKAPSLRRTLTVGAFLLFAGVGFFAGRLSADQPHMQAALDRLQEAKHELDAADADKGGHRTKALQLVREAIAQVEKGIEYDRHH